MKKLLSLGAVSPLFAVTTLAGSTLSNRKDRDSSEGTQDRFIGAWRRCGRRRGRSSPPA
jgi:hypothetical protein